MFGGVSGLFLGFVLFGQDVHLDRCRKLGLFWTGLGLFLVLLMSLVILSVLIRKCTPSNIALFRYIYFC